jgi:hypothetical protein
VVKDLIVDRSAFERIIQAGGFISVRTGQAPEANALPVPKDDAELSMDAAAWRRSFAPRLRVSWTSFSSSDVYSGNFSLASAISALVRP